MPMRMWELMASHRHELFDLCVQTMKRDAPERSDDELGKNFHPILDEVIGALRKAEGWEDDSPLPEQSALAALVGHQRYQDGFTLGMVSQTFGCLSSSLGELGARHHLSFRAEEYKHFNIAIDRCVKVAIEEYANAARQEQDLRTNERIGLFAHELRNAVSSGKLALGMLERSQCSLRGPPVDVLHRSLTRIEALVGQALLQVRTKSQPPPAVHPLSLLSFLKEMAIGTVLERGIVIDVDVPTGLVVLADDHLLTSVMANLLQNAIKFSHDGARVTVRASRHSDSVFIEVEDGCGGLPPGPYEAMFEPFVQQGTDRRGVGLGLAASRRALEAMHGGIAVRDLAGKGCIFSVCIAAPPLDPPREPNA